MNVTRFFWIEVVAMVVDWKLELSSSDLGHRGNLRTEVIGLNSRRSVASTTVTLTGKAQPEGEVVLLRDSVKA